MRHILAGIVWFAVAGAALAQTAANTGVAAKAVVLRLQLPPPAYCYCEEDRWRSSNASDAAGFDRRQGFTLGPVSLDMDSVPRPGDAKPIHFANIRVNDLNVWGGSVSGAFDGRAATLKLSWSTGN